MKTALVTGANKGIGLEVCRQLAKSNVRVFLTARNSEKGKAAVELLKQREGTEVEFIQLDISSTESVYTAVKELNTKITKLDILVNNAGIFLDLESENTQTILDIDPKLIDISLYNNALSPLYLTRALVPLLARSKEGARVINVSSTQGQLQRMGNSYPAYAMSKTLLNAITRQMAGAFEQKKLPIVVNSLCPGWVKTDMGGEGATRSLEAGAETIIWLAMEAPFEYNGQFWRDKQPYAW